MIYTGEIENGQLHGKGKITYANGEKYEVKTLGTKSAPQPTFPLWLSCGCRNAG